ncbi:MAG: CCA tRNA nucleotidyltransferase [Armatimonadetes bacterium]|nr:CCA tRNA nucleotidyltransferase [Armatimonadota bacterium]
MDFERLIQQLARAFADRQLFLVGGCLRDQLLGRPVSDLDLATDARPDDIRTRVEPWADAVWLVGEKFGTVGLQKDGVKAEITTFRADTYDGVSRKPEVAFGTDVNADLSRRDFTINAMARSVHSDELLDPFSGQRDLDARLVRFVGDASERIREDPLRMLRAVRFCAQLGFELDPVGAVAIATAADELPRISLERVRDELDGILLSARPSSGVRLMIDVGLAAHVMPGLLTLHLPEPGRHHMKNVLEHTLDAVDHVPAQKSVRYAALLHDIAKPETFSSDESGVHFYRHETIGAERARDILSRLRQPSALIGHVAKLIEHHLRIPQYRSEWSNSAVRRLMFDLGEQLEDAVALAQADVRASDPSDYPEFEQRLDELRARVHRVGEAAELAKMKPLLNGDEVMELLGLEPGPRVGEVLHYLLDQQIDGAITTRDQALAAVRQRFAQKE